MRTGEKIEERQEAIIYSTVFQSLSILSCRALWECLPTAVYFRALAPAWSPLGFYGIQSVIQCLLLQGCWSLPVQKSSFLIGLPVSSIMVFFMVNGTYRKGEVVVTGLPLLSSFTISSTWPLAVIAHTLSCPVLPRVSSLPCWWSYLFFWFHWSHSDNSKLSCQFQFVHITDLYSLFLPCKVASYHLWGIIVCPPYRTLQGFNANVYLIASVCETLGSLGPSTEEFSSFVSSSPLLHPLLLLRLTLHLQNTGWAIFQRSSLYKSL